ncbi:hypothetical protein GOP47_0025589 [Adiantum capillus-veneris]|uniref:Phthiocerol/phthiodiolone dimycocerosyl transferase C-terminal domain-containing protein n=1 Tax=Adiantum capillus-veneris TaxID=13818 RepID=A0A9D4U0U4_ADICA|nr:hypothetical protein GOP47_0025589 [Adiantum capillus-veneris]
MAQAVDDEVQAMLMSESPHSRMVGGTEYSWCKAVSGGTGTTALAAMFKSDAVSPIFLQTALDKLQVTHPRLRSRLIWIHGRPALSVSPIPISKLQVLPADEFISSSAQELGILDEENSHVESDEDNDNDNRGAWLKLVERELNINSQWKEQSHSLEPQPMIALTLYVGVSSAGDCDSRPFSCSLLVLRLHTAICDRASAATIFTELMQILGKLRANDDFTVKGEFQDEVHTLGEKQGHSEEEPITSLVAIEDAIPKGQADKPFWAHGLDILGYSLGSRRHATLPFQNVEQSERHSEIICKKLGPEDTQKLLKECKAQGTSRLGAVTAAVLKATAILKELGARSEHHAVVTLLDCRHRLEPAVSKSAVGFYHSALLNTHLVQGEEVQFWELARRCSEAVENAVKRRKHFTDMGDVGLLMCQAIQMPQLTPWGSLRTSTLVVFEETVEDDDGARDMRQSVGLIDYVGCSSVHGVGPSIAVFDTIRQGALHCTCVYPSPLHSRSQMNRLLGIMKSILVNMT